MTEHVHPAASTPQAQGAPSGAAHHAHMAEEFKRRFWISLALTLPILVLSPMLQALVGLREAIRFPGDVYVLFGLSSAVFWYGGWPFLKGLFKELSSRTPGMMTLVAVAISTAYLYSSAVVFGLTGKMFFWELATLVDIMLLGHWIEMKSVMGASKALEELARLMPSDAHKILPDGIVTDDANNAPAHGREPWNVPLCQVQAASKNRGDSGVADQGSQLLGEAFADAAGCLGNVRCVGTRSSLPRQHAPEHPRPPVVTRHRLNTSGRDSIFLPYRRTGHASPLHALRARWCRSPT